MQEIDVLYLGRPQAICCFALDGVIIDPGPEPSLGTLLEALGDDVPARILLTHIHLDHAGATGALVRRWPEVEVWVHERGAQHLIEPSKLIESATRLYGDDMDRLFGEIVPVPEGNIRQLEGGEQIGPWRVAYTPGHASHHVCYLHEPTGTAFVGDTGGMRIEGGPLFPPTVPPDLDLEAWHAALDLIAAWSPARLAITHFGSFEDVDDQLAAVHEALDRWADLARETDVEGFTAQLEADLQARGGPEIAASMLAAIPRPAVLWAGLDRYWQTRNG